MASQPIENSANEHPAVVIFFLLYQDKQGANHKMKIATRLVARGHGNYQREEVGRSLVA